jgi:hypothetical protein
LHRKQAKSTTKCIGRVNGIEDIVKVCANLCAIHRRIVDFQGGGVPFPP